MRTLRPGGDQTSELRDALRNACLPPWEVMPRAAVRAWGSQRRPVALVPSARPTLPSVIGWGRAAAIRTRPVPAFASAAADAALRIAGVPEPQLADLRTP